MWAAREVVARLNDADVRRPVRALGRARAWCEHPVRLAGTSRDADAATGEVVREFSTDGRAGRRAAEAVRQPPRARVRPVLGGLPRRRLAARRLGAARRQGRAGDGRGASARVRDLHGAELRAGAHGPRDVGGKRLACRPRSRGETCPHGRSLACGKRHARRRSVPGRGDLPGLLRLRAVRAVEPQRGPAVQAHADLRRARARPPGRHHAEGRARAGARVLREGGRVPAPRRRALPHALAPGRRRRRAGRRRPSEFDAQLLADAITAALPKSTVPAEDADAEPYGWGRQHEVRALELGDDPRRRRGSPATSPSTRPSRPRTPAASARGSSTSTSSTTCAAATTHGA